MDMPLRVACFLIAILHGNVLGEFCMAKQPQNPYVYAEPCRAGRQGQQFAARSRTSAKNEKLAADYREIVVGDMADENTPDRLSFRKCLRIETTRMEDVALDESYTVEGAARL